MFSFNFSMSTGCSSTTSYTGPGWGPSEGEVCGCLLLFPLHLNPQMTAASRAPTVKDSRKTVMETPTTAPAPRPTVVPSISCETEEDVFHNLSFLTVPFARLMYCFMSELMLRTITQTTHLVVPDNEDILPPAVLLLSKF